MKILIPGDAFIDGENGLMLMIGSENIETCTFYVFSTKFNRVLRIFAFIPDDTVVMKCDD